MLMELWAKSSTTVHPGITSGSTSNRPGTVHIAEGLRQLAGAVRITPHQCHHRQSVVDVVLPRHPNVVGGAGRRELHTEQVPGLKMFTLSARRSAGR